MNLSFAYLADRPEAVPLVASWWFGQWGNLRSNESVEDVTARLRQQLSRDRAPIQIVAVANHAVVGVAVLKLHEMIDLYPERQFWLGSVFVAPEHRGRGIGAALAMKIADVARSQNANAIHLQTQSLDGGLYAKLGWEPIEAVHYRGYDALVMVKDLKLD